LLSKLGARATSLDDDPLGIVATSFDDDPASSGAAASGGDDAGCADERGEHADLPSEIAVDANTLFESHPGKNADATAADQRVKLCFLRHGPV
jgi:hypothetical protein